ncbi:hypothetical protein TRICI_000764 [Trichomonascus ciferrii]|uniref:Phosphotransferase n=1 Tax=Trichomonascus ciferrii TaxID=44093 RepID=A0A642VAF2_9ASCO|nr:hypothetical protein TRICI_000764 [Trichomonascus ciferrii]
MRTQLHDPQSQTMLASCVTRLPSGGETGAYLSVDLGGSTARVAFVQLHGHNKHTVRYRAAYPVDDATKCLSGRGFFLWLARKVRLAVDHAVAQGWVAADYPDLVTGLSWSFPFQQKAINRGAICAMGKGYGVTDEIMGWDLAEALERAGREAGVRVIVKAIVNDTTASLVARAYNDPTTRMSLILGTGINACAMYALDMLAPGKLEGLTLEPDAFFSLVNTESSMVGAGIIPTTCWDDEIDRCNERPGYQPLEQKVSGRYIGELARLIMHELVGAGLLCGGVMPQHLDTAYGFKASVMSDMEEHATNGRLDLAREVFLRANPLDASELTDQDVRTIVSIITAVSTRAAALTAATLVALATLLPEEKTDAAAECTIAYDGTVIEKYPNFRRRCQDYLDALGLPRGRKLTLKPANDSSLLGPAITAAMYAHKDDE